MVGRVHQIQQHNSHLQAVRLGGAHAAQCGPQTNVAHCGAGRGAADVQQQRQPVGGPQEGLTGVRGRLGPSAAAAGAPLPA